MLLLEAWHISGRQPESMTADKISILFTSAKSSSKLSQQRHSLSFSSDKQAESLGYLCSTGGNSQMGCRYRTIPTIARSGGGKTLHGVSLGQVLQTALSQNEEQPAAFAASSKGDFCPGGEVWEGHCTTGFRFRVGAIRSSGLPCLEKHESAHHLPNN